MTRPPTGPGSSPESVRDVPAYLEGTLDKRWRRYRKAFDRCRKEFSEDSVHQLRVETRRLLALLDLLDSLATGAELRDCRRALKRFFHAVAIHASPIGAKPPSPARYGQPKA